MPGLQKSGQVLAWHPAKEKLPEGVDSALWREKAGTFVAWAHEKLIKNEAQLSYLAGRGIGKETAIEYKLGYNPGQGRLHAYFRPRPSWGLPPGKRLMIPDGVVIPYFRNNEVLRIRIRRSLQNTASEFFQRYYVVPGSIMTPMIIGSEMKAFVVVETDLDALMLYQEVGDLVGVLAVGSAMAKPGPDAYEV